MYDLDKSRNCVYSLQYHLITTVKYRKKVFTNDAIISELKVIFEKIASDFDVQILECECGDDHAHILFRSKPTLEIGRAHV